MVATYPEAVESDIDPEAERVLASVVEIIHAIRNARAQHKVEAGRWIEASIYAARLISAITPYADTIQTLARVRPVTFGDGRRRGRPNDNDLVLVLKEVEVVIPMATMVDPELEKRRLMEERRRIQGQVARLESRLNDKDFLTKAPQDVVKGERERLNALRDKLKRLI